MTPEERRTLIEAIKLARLTDTKLVVLLMAILGWKQSEIGEVLGLDARTVSYHWTDAVRRLSVLMQQTEV